MVEKSAASVAAAKYPSDLLEMIVVDDGSADDTWNPIERAASRFPGQVNTVRFPKNRGTRSRRTR